MTKIAKANQIFNKQFKAKFDTSNIGQGLIKKINQDVEIADNKTLGSDNVVDLARDVVFGSN